MVATADRIDGPELGGIRRRADRVHRVAGPLRILAVGFALLVAAACVPSGPAAGEPWLVYQAWEAGEEGGAQPALIVANTSGEELRRIELPTAELGPPGGMRLGEGYRALYPTRDDSLLLITAEQGTVQTLSAPHVLFVDRSRFPVGSRWAVLTDVGAGAHLLNLGTGELFDFRSLSDDLKVVGWCYLSADEEHLLIRGLTSWLVPTADPAAARRLIDDPWPMGFSADGQQIIYALRTGAASGSDAHRLEVSVESLDGSGRVMIGDFEGFPGALALLASRGQIVVQPSHGGPVLVDLADGASTELAAPPGTLMPHVGRWYLVSPDGDSLLAVHESPAGESWHTIDVAENTSADVSELQDMDWLWFRPTETTRWLLFGSDPPYAPGPVELVAFDFQTGEATRMDADLEADGATVPLAVSDDGRVAIVAHMTDPQAWLLDLEEGSARRLECVGKCVGAALSPDGRWVALVDRRPDAGGETDVITLTIVSTDGQQRITVGPGFLPTWVNP